jgi:NAD-reducing hydrogenase small subunit
MSEKIRMATVSLAGCFGCHMSLLDIDERLLELVERVEFDRCPFNDIKTIGDCDVGFIEGGVANADNVEVLREFRRRCKVLVSVGACAINGGIPSMRNLFDVRECLEESYLNEPGLENPGIPDDPEIPLLLNRVHPIHEVVKIDYFVPGCPPSADTLWTFLTGLIEAEPVFYPYRQIRYD